jgi:hypothetical protein
VSLSWFRSCLSAAAGKLIIEQDKGQRIENHHPEDVILLGHGYGETSLYDAGRDVLRRAAPDHGEQWIMQTSNAKGNFNYDDTGWVLLAEIPFMDFLSDQDQRDKPVVSSMLQTLLELGMSREDMENIARTLAGFARKALVRTKQRGLEFPARIRIFCQKKMINDANSAKSARPPEQVKKQRQMFPDFGVSRIGGCGCFMLERGEDLRSASDAIPRSCIDLYLYKEGDWNG